MSCDNKQLLRGAVLRIKDTEHELLTLYAPVFYLLGCDILNLKVVPQNLSF